MTYIECFASNTSNLGTEFGMSDFDTDDPELLLPSWCSRADVRFDVDEGSDEDKHEQEADDDDALDEPLLLFQPESPEEWPLGPFPVTATMALLIAVEEPGAGVRQSQFGVVSHGTVFQSEPEVAPDAFQPVHESTEEVAA